jgi:hypothetical protein
LLLQTTRHRNDIHALEAVNFAASFYAIQSIFCTERFFVFPSFLSHKRSFATAFCSFLHNLFVVQTSHQKEKYNNNKEDKVKQKQCLPGAGVEVGT